MRLFWRYPEWWCVALSAAAWLALLPGQGHAHHHHAQASVASQLLQWLAMVAAMMYPLVLDPVRVTAARSLWKRRHRAIAGFLLGYTGIWMLVGICISQAASVLPSGSSLALAGGFALAAAWHFTPIRRRATRACHRTIPIAPEGWRAGRDCIRYGWTVGKSCVASCWALMLACALAGHSFNVMVTVFLIGAFDRYAAHPGRPMIFSYLPSSSKKWASVLIPSK